MSGHSKFANIKHKKEKNDAAKGKIFLPTLSIRKRKTMQQRVRFLQRSEKSLQ